MKKTELFFSVFFMMIFAMAGEAEATLLWDGSFDPSFTFGKLGYNDRSQMNMYRGGEQIYQYTCMPQWDSFTVVNANTLPGGRTGYAGKFYMGTTEAGYDCATNRHNMLQARIGIPNPKGYHEVWYGWSQYLKSPYSPAGGPYGTGSIGLSMSSYNYVTGNQFTYSGTGFGISMSKNSWQEYMTAGSVRDQKITIDGAVNQENIWYDYMYHINYQSTAIGFIEVYRRRLGETNYKLIYSKYGYQTEVSQGWPESQQAYWVHVGQYGASGGAAQTIYVMNPKVGTTRADVEYGGTTNPTPICTDNIQNQGETGIDCGGPCSACSSTPSTTPLALKPGWNQISSPLAAGIDLAAIEQSCTILQYKNQKLWAWNAQAQSWTNPTKIEPLKSYWVYVAYVCTVPLSGTPATFSSLQLYSGWNKVSAQGSLSAIEGTCAGHITGNWIWNWDKATEKWIHPATMQLDKGYWIKVDQDCVFG